MDNQEQEVGFTHDEKIIIALVITRMLDRIDEGYIHQRLIDIIIKINKGEA